MAANNNNNNNNNGGGGGKGGEQQGDLLQCAERKPVIELSDIPGPDEAASGWITFEGMHQGAPVPLTVHASDILFVRGITESETKTGQKKDCHCALVLKGASAVTLYIRDKHESVVERLDAYISGSRENDRAAAALNGAAAYC